MKYEIDGVETTTCLYCEHQLAGNNSSGTSHLKRHLELCPEKKNKYIRQKLLSKSKVVQEQRG